MIDLTPIIEAVIALIAALVSVFLIPCIKSKVLENKLAEIMTWVQVAVEAAEQLYKESGQGAKKKQYVLDFLASKGFTLNEDEIDKLIESAVYALKGGV